MPVSVRGTDILFNDGTTQSTAGGAPTTTQVLNATAGAAAGAVGTYAWLYYTLNTPASIAAGGTAAGSNLRYAGTDGMTGVAFSGTPSGTWRLMGYLVPNGSVNASSWLRIS